MPPVAPLLCVAALPSTLQRLQTAVSCSNLPAATGKESLAQPAHLAKSGKKALHFFAKGDCHKTASFLVRNLFVPFYRVGCGCNTALQHWICCHVCPSGLSHCYPFVYNQNILTRKIYSACTQQAGQHTAHHTMLLSTANQTKDCSAVIYSTELSCNNS